MEIRSKDQALAQCGNGYDSNLPNARLIPVTSTAEAVRESAAGKGIVIASKLAGEAHGVPMLDSGIQDRKDNVTRFLSSAAIHLPKEMGYPTEPVSFFLPDQVGALQSSFNPFSHAGSIFARLSPVRASVRPGIISSCRFFGSCGGGGYSSGIE